MKKFISFVFLMLLVLITWGVAVSLEQCTDGWDNDGDGDTDTADAGCLDGTDVSERNYGYQIAEATDIEDDCLSTLETSGIDCVSEHYQELSWYIAFAVPSEFSSCLDTYSSDYYGLTYDSSLPYTAIAVGDCVYDHYNEYSATVESAFAASSADVQDTAQDVCFHAFYDDYASDYCALLDVGEDCDGDDSRCASGICADTAETCGNCETYADCAGFDCDPIFQTCYESCTEGTFEGCYSDPLDAYFYVCSGGVCVLDTDGDETPDTEDTEDCTDSLDNDGDDDFDCEDDDCDSDAACAATLGFLGDTCTGDDGCESGICITESSDSNEWVCADCNGDEDCVPYGCSEEYGASVAYVYQCYDFCDEDPLCASGYTCENIDSGTGIGECIEETVEGSVADGDSCSGDSQCISGHCAGSFGVCIGCEEDSHCSDGFACDPALYYCYDSCASAGEAACADAYTCSTDGNCYLECASYQDCQSGYTCESSACNPSAGDGDSDGIPNEEDDRAETEQCFENDQCASGLECTEGFCAISATGTVDIGGGCDEAEDCASGICSSLSTCGECDDDGDCTNGFACYSEWNSMCWTECSDEEGCASGYACGDSGCDVDADSDGWPDSDEVAMGGACSSGEDAECAEGYCFSTYVCTECSKEGEGCDEGETCDDGICIAQCSDADCGAYVCNAEENVCYESCTSDDQCGDAACVTDGSGGHLGECIVCEDGESGQDLLTAGSITEGVWYTTGIYWSSQADDCQDADTLKEYFCTSDFKMAYSSHTCSSEYGTDYVCSDGACVSTAAPAAAPAFAPEERLGFWGRFWSWLAFWD